MVSEWLIFLLAVRTYLKRTVLHIIETNYFNNINNIIIDKNVRIAYQGE